MAKNQVSENNNRNDEAAEAEAWKLLEQRIAKLKNYDGLNYIQLGKWLPHSIESDLHRQWQGRFSLLEAQRRRQEQ